MFLALLTFLLNAIVVFVLVVRVMTRPHRDPASRIAWIAVIASMPGLGMIAYLLLGETNIGSKRIARMNKVLKDLPPMAPIRQGDEQNATAEIPARYQHLFQAGKSINEFDPVGGNTGQLMDDSNTTIDFMVSDIDAATESVHLSFYIWLTDRNGLRMVEALKRAAKRGVKCRAIADDLGSSAMIKSNHWRDMQESGVDVARALPIGNLLTQPLRGRLDLRNHRKVLVIDDRITYCGSQNCADPEFLVKEKFAPWVDMMIRFEGPIVRQNQYLFSSDWMSYGDDETIDYLRAPIDAPQQGFPAQVIATGPTFRFSAMPQMFESLFHAARHELIITTPYFVPDESMQDALCAAGWRGVKTVLILPARNDSWIVGGASHSYYKSLLDAGVEIHEYQDGLLHAKSLTLDGEVTLIGSANMDRRSFDLNYENNILFYDPKLTMDVYERQQQYLACSEPVSLEQVDAWPLRQRLWNNTLATLGPIL